MHEIYVAHSAHFDYKTELYDPIRNSSLNSQYKFILPYESDKLVNSKETIRQSDLVIAEVSYQATGEGIELGWADVFSVPIICLYKEGVSPSRSLSVITGVMLSYANVEDMIAKISEYLSSEKAFEK